MSIGCQETAAKNQDDLLNRKCFGQGWKHILKRDYFHVRNTP